MGVSDEATLMSGGMESEVFATASATDRPTTCKANCRLRQGPRKQHRVRSPKIFPLNIDHTKTITNLVGVYH